MYIDREPRKLFKATVDTTHVCNLKCDYCLQGWKSAVRLPAEKIAGVFKAAESKGLLEVFLSGAETTLHPELERILQDTHILEKTGSSLITNGTTMTPEMVGSIRRSNIRRVCISIDGADSETHSSARGNNFDEVMRGLHMLQDTGKPITVISVAHQKNQERLLDLSSFLAKNHLASQHNITAVSRSGLAIDQYEQMRLKENDFEELQKRVNSKHETLLGQGLDTIFTSYWLATGKRSEIRNPRELTLFELSEQLKDCNVVVRAKGDVQLTAAAWAREFLVDGVVGNIYRSSADDLFSQAEATYQTGSAYQLPRTEEARQKYSLGDKTPAKADLIPVIPIEDFDLLRQSLREGQIVTMAENIRSRPDNYRMVKGSPDVYVLFNKGMSHVTLLRDDEVQIMDSLTQTV